MGEVVAIISEYNPFHNGHKYQIDRIKEIYPDATIIAIMSGNIVQRGELALIEKYNRARAAVLCGVDCVFELPYPFCASCAEIFARAGVYLAMQLGATHLCFGVEQGNVENLTHFADALDKADKEDSVNIVKQDRSISYPKLLEKLCNVDGNKIPNMSNMILGIEYIRSIRRYGNKLIPYTVERKGFGYNDLSVGNNMSATAIRAYFTNNNTLISVPENTEKLYEQIIENKEFTVIDEIKDYLFKSVIMMDPKSIDKCYDTPSGVGFFIYDLARNSRDADEFFENLTTKTYTYARLRRIILYALLGVERIDKEPAYTSLLASSGKGREHLKSLKKKSKFPILTKLADYKKMDDKAVSQFEASARADMLFTSFLKNRTAPLDFIKKMPFISE